MSYAVELKTRKFKTLFDYWLWYYRNLLRWRTGRGRDIFNLGVAARQGHAIRMKEIARRKTLTLEQRRKEKARRAAEGAKARLRGRERRAAAKARLTV